MSEDFGTPITPVVEDQKRSNTLIIVIAVIVLVMLFCCCAIVGAVWALWTYGDQWFNITVQVLQSLT